MSSDFHLYKDARESINGLIMNREQDIKDLEDEIRQLKSTRRMLDEEFKNNLQKTEKHFG